MFRCARLQDLAITQSDGLPTAPVPVPDVPLAVKMRYPMGAPGRRLSRGPLALGGRFGPVAGDWLSGRAPRSHRGGHWFDPSIAHRCKARSEAPRTAPILRTGWELSPHWEKFGRLPFSPLACLVIPVGRET